MDIISDTIDENGMHHLVIHYSDEERAEMAKRAEEHRAEMEKRRAGHEADRKQKEAE